ncbi:MAG: hypothetical protein ACR2NM_05135 [Bythopirellula sp.]
MSSEPSPNQPSGISAVSPAVRQRLQKVFEHGQRCLEKQDHDYANKLFTQCLIEDPCNLVYLQSCLANLQQKYGNNQKGSRLAGLKLKNQRSAFTKATGKGDWSAAFTAGCAALSVNPWDIASLLAWATAYENLHSDECELFCLRNALHGDAKNIAVNRQAGIALQRMGQFDQAIACWQRVKLALPADEQARQAIAALSVEQTIDKGGYDSTLLTDSQRNLPVPNLSVAQLAKDSDQVDDEPPEVRLQAAITADPTEAKNYVHLADIYLQQRKFDEAEQLLSQGASACGSGDLQIRTRVEDVQLRRVAHQLAIAQQQCGQDPSDEGKQLAHRLKVQANQVELEIYAARSERDPTNFRLKYEVALRLKRAGKVKQAITAFQAAKADPRREVTVLVELGECFQHVEQYKLALSHYEQAVGAADDKDSELYRKALYRAGVLSTGMEEFDRAERHLSTLASLDYGYRDVAERLDKLAKIRDKG